MILTQLVKVDISIFLSAYMQRLKKQSENLKDDFT